MYSAKRGLLKEARLVGPEGAGDVEDAVGETSCLASRLELPLRASGGAEPGADENLRLEGS